MRSPHIQIITTAVVLLLAACSEGGAQQTLVAENAMLSTQIVDVRTTATYEADELKQTQEYIETIVPRANRLRDEISSTLQAAGIDVTQAAVQANPNFTLATPPPVQSSGNSNAQSQQPVIVEGTTIYPSAEPNSGISGPATGPTATVGEPMLFNLVTSEGVGSNDCALSSVTAFSPDTAQIYIVATASNVTAGSTLTAQWYLNDTLLVKQDFSPKDDINNNCIWFYAEPVDFPFTPGNYRVDLLINGNAVAGAQANFTIQGADQTTGG